MKNGFLWGCAATLLGTLGCAMDEHCDALDQCGGRVLSNSASDFADADGLVDTEWWAYAGDECQDPLHTPPLQNALANQFPHLSNEAPPERSSMDWCSNLVFNSDRTIKQVNLWFPQIPLRDANLVYSANTSDATTGDYVIQFRYFKRMRADFSAQCMTAQGVVMGCTEFTAAMRVALENEPNISQINCDPGPQRGCRCIYDMLLVSGVSGPWRRTGDVITHYDEITGEQAEADYCVNGSNLEMTGHDRTWLFNQSGLRTMQMVQATCADGFKNQGEGGDDCGGPCPADCCVNGAQETNEQGIDCGGVCPTPCP